MTLFDFLRRGGFCRRGRAAIATALITAAVPVLADQAQTEKKSFTQSPVIAASQVPSEKAEPNASDGNNAAQPDIQAGPNPIWIWGQDHGKDYVLRKQFPGGAKSALLIATCDNRMELSLNGQKLASSEAWQHPVRVDVQKSLQPKANELLVKVGNAGGAAGFALKLILTMPDGSTQYVISDKTWQAAERKESDQWGAVTTHGVMGVGPWNDVFGQSASSLADAPRDVFNLPPGFRVELLFTVPKDELGSWVNIISDPKGRLIVSDQGNLGLCRITPAPLRTEPQRASGGSGDAVTKVEHLDIKFDGKQMSGAQGLLWAFDSLYVVCNGGPGSGLYRCKDTDGDDQFDKVEKLRDIPGGGEHGPHAIRLSPDGKSLFVAAGNHTKLPFEIKTNAPPQLMGGQRTEQLRATLPEGFSSRLMPNWDEDVLLPRYWDPSGHAAGVLAPGGWICQIDPDGKTWEVFSSGYRNQFDFAFNADGEMFAYDADMEYDFGSPWHRPTRVVHATSGSEFGWRSGTGKWPSYYIDSLPELINIGPGSPVGVEFGYGTKFPAKYQKALFICDWTFGTMYAIHIEPHGSSYKATKEEFVSRTPLPLTDCTVGKDGALYFTIGGRGAQSELFRVTYVGKEDTTPVDAQSPTPSAGKGATTQTESPDFLRNRRRNIERRHVSVQNDSTTIQYLCSWLTNEDRHLSYAARVALERIPIKSWLPGFRAFLNGLRIAEPMIEDPIQRKRQNAAWKNMIIGGCVALARQADPDMLPTVLGLLDELAFGELTEQQQLGLLRAYQLAFIRLGNPDKETCAALAKKFDDLFPQKSDFVNRELSILMIHFQSPGAVKKLVPLLLRTRPASDSDAGSVGHDLLSRNKGYGGVFAAMLANQPDQQQYHYAFVLRNLKTGWTLDDRKAYFAWFEKARTWSGGASYPKYLTNIDNDAFANCTDAERLAIEALGIRKPYVIPELPKANGPGKDYSVEEVLALATDKLKARDFKNGEKMYKAARCVVCHRFGGDGGATGPDLTQLAGRFNLKDLTDAIVDPSKIISDQYKASVVETKDGKVITGRIVSESKETITVVIDPENATKVAEIKKADIEESQPSKVSLMPKDLLKTLNEDEVRDLLAYLLSRGNPNDAMFRK